MSSVDSATVPDQRKLTPAQNERRRSVLSAARALAYEGGYEAVTISAVAKRAGVSRSTLYHYFDTKGHLLTELTFTEAAELNANLDALPPMGSSPEDRVGEALERIVDWSLKKPKLFEAIASAWISNDTAAPFTQRLFNIGLLEHINTGFGESSVADASETARTLEHVVFSCLVRLSKGLMNRDQAVKDLRLAARLLIVAPPHEDRQA